VLIVTKASLRSVAHLGGEVPQRDAGPDRSWDQRMINHLHGMGRLMPAGTGMEFY
jgi:hypothetical protein